MKKLLVVDGNSIINRAFFGVRLLSTKDGLYTNAIFGFLNILHKLTNDEKPDALCVTFDLKAPTFRHLKYDGYKAQRKGMPEELAVQMPLLREVLDAMGIKRLELEGRRTKADRDAQDKNRELLELERSLSRTEQRKLAAEMEEKQLLDKLWDNPPDYLECYKVLKTTWEIALGVVNFTMLMMIPFLGKIAGVGFVGMLTAVFSSAAAAGGAAAAATTAVVCTVISTVLVGITIIVVVVLLVVALIYLILYLVDYYSHPYSDQPTIMLDSPSTPTAKNFKDIVVKYYAVRGPDGKPADVNGLNGKKWNTLYYTKDSRLGSPLVKGPNGQFFFDQMGGIKRQDDAMPIAKFGSVSPFNMNNNCFQDTVGGHYFWYYTEESMNPAGTQSQDQKYIKNNK